MVLLCCSAKRIGIARRVPVEGFNPYNFIGVAVIFSFWGLYGYLDEQSLQFVLINFLGVAMQFIYVVVYSRFCGAAQRKRLCILAGIGAVFLAMVVLTSLWVCDTCADRVYFVGFCSVAITIGVYVLPIGIIVWNRMANNIEPTPTPTIIIVSTILRAGMWLLYSSFAGNAVMIISTLAGFFLWVFPWRSLDIYYTPTPTPTRQSLKLSR